jgi:PAS domain-containing protein
MDDSETKRLEVLLDYAILDTKPEPAFDELTALAAEMCDVPVSMISLVDRDRQWFKAKTGVDTVESPRAHSFCAHALHQPGLFIVPDATADKRFVDNPLVTGEPHIRFYAGAPLLTGDGFALGTLCVIDRLSRKLTQAQSRGLSILSRQVMAQFELRRRTVALIENEVLLYKMYRNCPVAVSLRNWSNDAFIHVNHAFSDLVERPREEIIGRKAADLGLPSAKTLEKKPEKIISIPSKNGEPRRVLIDSSVILDSLDPQVVTTFVDITELEKAEEILRLNDGRLRRLHDLVRGLSAKKPQD